ncbi:IS110 family transposase, partial [Mycobacterium paragordonae]|uniref:IS110 family transposase n=1 Tax=Mycobacterium paragordonae TaxID=1389713 RepID=UPI001F0D6CB6
AAQRRGVGKTDALDAVRIARSVLAVDITRLRTPRADGQRVALRVLTVAREEMVAERTRAINALTALLRTVDLGLDVRKALPHSQFKAIAAWRDRKEDPSSPPAGRNRSGWPSASSPSTASWSTTVGVSIPSSRMSLPNSASCPGWVRSWPPAS